jgi:hypothetical protein
MKWNRCALVLPLAAAALARADDAAPKKFELLPADRWDAGEVVTETSHREVKVVFATVAEGAAPSERRVYLTDDATLVRRATAIGADGRPSASVVFVKDWLHSEDDSEDKSLAGALLEVGADGWTMLTPGVRPSAAARAWLDHELKLTPHDISAETRFVPAGAVAAGETWKSDDRRLFDEYAKLTVLAAPGAAVASSGTLASVDEGPAGPVAHVTFVSDAPLEGAATFNGRSMQLAKGGTYHLSGTADGDPAHRHRSMAQDLTAKFDVSIRRSATSAFTIRLTVTQTNAAAPGGEMPAPPAADAAQALTYRFARSAGWKAGETFGENGKKTIVIDDTPVGSDGKAGEPKHATVTTTWTDVRRCEAVGADGSPERFTVLVKSWSHDDGTTNDTSLAGALVDVGPRGWKLRDPDVKPSDDAKRWLSNTYGSAAAVGGDDPLRAVVTPISPVAVGGTWSPDETTAAALARGWFPLPVDADDAVATAKLRASTGAAAAASSSDDPPLEVSFTIDLPVHCVAGCAGADNGPKGSIEILGTSTGRPADWSRSGGHSDTAKLTGTFRDAESFHQAVITQTRTITRTAGGEFPADAAGAK